MPRSKASKFIHLFYLLIIAVLVTLLFVERQEQGSEPDLANVREQITQLQLSFEQRLSAFEQTVNTQLEQTNQAVANSNNEPRRSTAPPASSQNPPINQRLNEPAENEGTTAESIDETEIPRAHNSQRSNTATQADLHATLSAGLLDDFEEKETQFSMQSVDPDWAYPTRDLIQEQFNQNTYLKTLNLSNIECRSSLCQVDIEAQDQVTINPARLIRALNPINQNQQNYRYAFRNSSQGDIYRVIVERIEDRNQ